MFSSFELLVKYSNLRNIIISSRETLVRNELSVGCRGTMEYTVAFVSSPPVFCSSQSTFSLKVVLVIDGNRIIMNEGKLCPSMRIH
jgi:hypothetical protein